MEDILRKTEMDLTKAEINLTKAEIDRGKAEMLFIRELGVLCCKKHALQTRASGDEFLIP